MLVIRQLGQILLQAVLANSTPPILKRDPREPIRLDRLHHLLLDAEMGSL
jgi:hypothetical protein